MIVAGGEGGASGCSYFVDQGGFGGSLSGGNCYYKGSLQNDDNGIPVALKPNTPGFPRPDGNGNERGQPDHGYAKITPQ